MKLFQTSVAYLNGRSVSCDFSKWFPNDDYPNSDTYCYHDFFEIEIFMNGSGLHYIDSVPYKVDRRYFFIMKPGEYHKYALDPLIQFEIYNIKFRPELPDGRIIGELSRFSAPYSGFLSEEDAELCVNEAKRLGGIQYTEDEISRLMSKNIVERILITLISALDRGCDGGEQPDTKYLNVITDYIERHYGEKITKASLAKVVGLSENYIGTYFEKHIGMHFGEYIQRLRLNHAVLFLKTTDMSIKEIADRCGFSSQEYFSRVFREKYSVSPSRYRYEFENEKEKGTL